MSSTWPTPSFLHAETQTFPALTADQIERIRPVAKSRLVQPGEILFHPGDSTIPFFVLLSGKLDIVQPTLAGEREVTTHVPGAFTGELNMLNGQPSLVLARVSEAGEFLEVSLDGLRSLIARDAELSEIFMRAFILRRLALIANNFGNVVIMGSRHCAGTLRLREFLSRNNHPYNFVDLDADKTSQELLDRFHVKLEEVPVVICDGRTVLRNPSTHELAECLGLNANVDSAKAKDVIIVGAGLAGLAAAVYAASEGLDALLIETDAPGGQAGSSSKIENYLGFPTGVSGHELATRAIHQAQKFGAKMMVARSIVRLNCDQHPYHLELEDGTSLSARAIVIATGAQYKKPDLPNLKKYEGQGVYYGATYIESQLCEGEDVIVVGGGNSAGQAAVFLAQTARKVYMLVRSDGLAETMSRYLIRRITDNPKIELHVNTQITQLSGSFNLEQVEWHNKIDGSTTVRPIHHVFIMAGASPRTEWLRGCVALDDNGFILTGRDLFIAQSNESSTPAWALKRPPQMLETSLPGVFAIGDVRAGSVKRVASAVGEGAISVHLVHRTLAEI
jgi:thioredoxin reductase (NADPH)